MKTPIQVAIVRGGQRGFFFAARPPEIVEIMVQWFVDGQPMFVPLGQTHDCLNCIAKLLLEVLPYWEAGHDAVAMVQRENGIVVDGTNMRPVGPAVAPGRN